MRRLTLLSALLLSLLLPTAARSDTPKREFRGAWIQTIFQGYDRRSAEENRRYLTSLLDSLQSYGINAVIFQVRPRADAFFPSDIEPWSSFLTGKTGRAPRPAWDPLQFMVDECHNRGMELHAWLNPYRGPSVAESKELPAGHLLRKHPGRFVRYGKNYYFKPSLAENRQHICDIVADIVRRYDVDGIHFDDYFYPYPAGGLKFQDAKDYEAARTKKSLADWRRANVDALIEQVSHTINGIKPWVRFGISPFGIWRNVTSDPRGSRTSGLQNYDDLYADVPKWAEKGWIDYQIPQLYWELDHKRASYRELCAWWARNGRGRHVYIGQDAEKTHSADELDRKLGLIDSENIQGNCWWYAASLPALGPKLRARHYTARALVPEYIWKHAEPAGKPERLKLANGVLTWRGDSHASKWVVYRFDSGPEEIDIELPEAIEAVVYSPQFTPRRPGRYVVTALDRANGESAPSAPVHIRKSQIHCKE